MWDAIASNQRRSWVLVSLLGVVLLLVGATIGGALGAYVAEAQSASSREAWRRPEHRSYRTAWQPRELPGGGAKNEEVAAQATRTGMFVGLAVAGAVWLILWATAVGAGDSILLGAAKAREIQREDLPQLWNVVEEMTIAAGLSKMPRVFIIDDPALNAFAVGRRPEKAAVAVTSGLLKRLNRDELQGVIAHEIGHIRNLDIRFMTLAAVMLGVIVLLSQMFLRGLYYGGGRRRSSSRGGGGGAAILLLVAIAVAILAPLAAQLLYFACSRRREYLADASAALFTRYPEGLASALEKISRDPSPALDANKVVAPLCIVNPLQEQAAFSLFSTHPPTEKRIRILRSMAGAGLAAYEAAYAAVHGGKRCLSKRVVADAAPVPVRPPTEEPAARAAVARRAAAVGEVLDRTLPFVVIPCECGVRLKVPPDLRRKSIQCPRCGRDHAVPQAKPAGFGTAAGAASAESVSPLQYRRRGGGWESFRCNCGATVQLSLKHSAPTVRCPSCKRRIELL